MYLNLESQGFLHLVRFFFSDGGGRRFRNLSLAGSCMVGNGEGRLGDHSDKHRSVFMSFQKQLFVVYAAGKK